MGNTIVPVGELGNRMQEHGRIRLGVKTPKAMKAIDTFRFTSPDQEAIEQLAELYGGTAQAWTEPKANPPAQFQVITTSKEIRVFLPPESLSCWYELWSGGGCVRRCDGREVELVVRAGDESELSRVPCLCKQAGTMACRPHTRLNVIIPEIRFGGVWRLETKGWTAAHEMPAMEQLINQVQSKGIIEAMLALEKAEAQQGRRKFVVPRLRLAASALELAAGDANLTALHQGHRGMAELGPGPATPATADAEDPAEWFDPDDEVVDAELVDTPVETRSGELTPTEKKLVVCCNEAAGFLDLDADLLRHALARKASRGRTASSRELDPGELSQVIEWCEQLLAETHQVEVVRQDPPTVKITERRKP